MKPLVVAFHGGWLGPDDLRRDMGDPDWVDAYLKGFNSKIHYQNLKTIDRGLVLIAYSFGGNVVGNLSNTDLPILGAVLYETPLIGINSVGGNFPVVWIRNEFESTQRREAEFGSTYQLWAKNHPIEQYCGAGGHSNFRFGWPPFDHNWDTTLNPFIKSWIDDLS